MKRNATLIKSGDKRICIMDLSPKLKKPCLCIFEPPNTYRKVASFGGTQEAVIFMKYLYDMFTEGKNNEH
jgi:hypothetical protein